MATTLTDETDVDWLPKPNRVEFVRDSALADPHAITGVYVFAFQDEGLLLVLHAERGWDLPGADVEIGEPPAVALERAVLAGAGAELHGPVPLGYFRLQLPHESQQQYVQLFVARVRLLYGFCPTRHLLERKLVVRVEADSIEFLRQYATIYEAGLALVRAIDS